MQRVGARALRDKCDQNSHADRSRCDAKQSTTKRDQKALGKKLPCESPTRGTYCQPGGNLTRTGRRPRQEETRNIQTDQPQQYCRRGKQHPQRFRQLHPQVGMPPWSRRERERRIEIPLAAFSSDHGKAGAPHILLEHGLKPWFESRLSTL